MAKNNNSISIGNSGEYFVAAELERRGYTAAVPMSNTKDFDILAINRENPCHQIAIQVKTTQYKHKKWMLNQKCEKLKGNNIIYVLVALNELEQPEYHIIPSEYLAEKVYQSHREWLNTPGVNGQPHNDNPTRAFTDYDDKFLDRWDLLDCNNMI